MTSGLLGIALTGLNAAQAGIRTTENNIANVNTAGYRRQEAVFSSAQTIYTPSGYFGSGVSVDTVRSLYSQFLDNEALLSQTQLSRYETYSSGAAQIDKLLADSGSGLSTAIDTFFSAVNELANDPTSNAARQVLLSAGTTLAGRINMLDSKLRDYIESSNDQLSSLAGNPSRNQTGQVNVLAEQIAGLNESISRNEALTGQTANDLRDKRDQLISDLNKLLNVSTLQQSDGSVNLYIGNGLPLVVGSKAYTMSTAADPNDSSVLVPTLDLGGSTVTLDASVISGGTLGGLLALREEVVDPALDDLNRIAIAIGTEVNRVHQSGLDYNLAAGGVFFTDPVTGAAGNTGTLQFTLGNDQQLVRSNYTLTYDGTDYTLTRLSDGTTTVGTLAAVTAGQGFTLNAAVAPAAGDSWTIDLKDYAQNMSMEITSTAAIAAAGAGADGPGDNANALAIAALQTGSILNNGTVTFHSAYNQTISRTASLAAESDLSLSAFTSLAASAESAKLSVSGVNLDEEAVNLIRFQQAYQAASKAIQVASAMFDSLLGAVS
jgi:flagellar hook-associated protein 1 FlgK